VPVPDVPAGTKGSLKVTTGAAHTHLFLKRAGAWVLVTAGQTSASDAVTLRVVPLLTQHHLQNTQQVMVSKVQGDGPDSRLQREFVTALGKRRSRRPGSPRTSSRKR